MNNDFGAWRVSDPGGIDYGEGYRGSGCQWWKANADKGYFEANKGQQSSHYIDGILLQCIRPRAFFALDNQHPGHRFEAPYAFPKDSRPLCSCEGPGHPVKFHSGLNALHIQRLQQLGCGDCESCSAKWAYKAQDTGEEVYPYCQQSMKLLLMPISQDPNEEVKPMVLSVSAWLSIKSFLEFLDNEIRPKQMPLYGGMTRMMWGKTTNKRGSQVNVMTFQLIGVTPVHMKDTLEGLISTHDMARPRQRLSAPAPVAQLPAGNPQMTPQVVHPPVHQTPPVPHVAMHQAPPSPGPAPMTAPPIPQMMQQPPAAPQPAVIHNPPPAQPTAHQAMNAGFPQAAAPPPAPPVVQAPPPPEAYGGFPPADDSLGIDDIPF